MPSGKLERASVSSTFTFGLVRGLGFHAYHSVIGATNVCGTSFITGCAPSSTLTRAGSDGQLLAPNRLPPRNSRYQVHSAFGNPDTWKPSHAPPPFM